jgi:hypothetical protein
MEVKLRLKKKNKPFDIIKAVEMKFLASAKIKK